MFRKIINELVKITVLIQFLKKLKTTMNTTCYKFNSENIKILHSRI